MHRCQWIQGKPDYYVAYHDHVWGKAEHDDQRLFMWLILESFHVGLSWQLVLSKYDHFVQAFDDFEIAKIANYGRLKVEELMGNPDIIRNRGKIEAAISNAQSFMKVQEEFQSFDHYIWSFTDRQTIVREDGPMLSQSPLSDLVSQDMKKRGFKFIGSVTIYSYLQAIGVINDHDIDCDYRF